MQRESKVKWKQENNKNGNDIHNHMGNHKSSTQFFFLFISFYPIYVYILHIKIETGRTDYDLMAFRRKRTLCHRYWPYGCHFCRRNLNGSDDECCGQFESDDICSIERIRPSLVNVKYAVCQRN